VLLIWTPPGADPREFIFRVDELTPDLYEPIEQVGPWDNLDDFVEAVMQSNRRAWRVALWTCLRRDDEPDLGLAAVQPRPGEISMRYEPAEELAMAEMALATPGLPEDRRAFYEAALPELRERAGKAGPGDVPSPPDDAPTAGTSQTSSD